MDEIASPPPQRTCLKLVVVVASGKAGMLLRRASPTLLGCPQVFAVSGPNQNLPALLRACLFPTPKFPKSSS